MAMIVPVHRPREKGLIESIRDKNIAKANYYNAKKQEILSRCEETDVEVSGDEQ